MLFISEVISKSFHTSYFISRKHREKHGKIYGSFLGIFEVQSIFPVELLGRFMEVHWEFMVISGGHKIERLLDGNALLTSVYISIHIRFSLLM